MENILNFELDYFTIDENTQMRLFFEEKDSTCFLRSVDLFEKKANF